MPDTDFLEQDTEQEVVKEQPEVTKVEHEAPAPTRDDLYQDALSEGVEEGVLAALADKQGDLTIDDLRQIPGSEDFTDEELMAQWKAIEAKEGKAEGETEGEIEAYKLPFPVYDKDGNKIDALEKIDLKDLFDGKLQFGYNALGKEQRKTLGETLRNASQGHFNEKRYSDTVLERNQVYEKLQAAQKQVDQYTNERKVWDAALTALAMGDIKPMQAIAQAYQKALLQQPQTPQAGMIPVTQVQQEQELMAKGVEYINNTIVPKGYEIAQRYGADPKEVLNAIQWYLEKEPAEFLTQEKIENIINHVVPALLEENGYSVANSGSVQGNQQTGTNAIEELVKKVEALQAKLAATANKETEAIRKKQSKIPPSGGGAVSPAGDSMPSFKNRQQMKAYMQGDPDWSKV